MKPRAVLVEALLFFVVNSNGHNRHFSSCRCDTERCFCVSTYILPETLRCKSHGCAPDADEVY